MARFERPRGDREPTPADRRVDEARSDGDPVSNLDAQRASRSGARLDDAIRAKYEARLGVGLGGVRIHADGAAAGLGARAYTTGEDIHLSNVDGGEQLLAHELVHVAQRANGVATGGVSDPSDASEREADALAPRLAAGEAVHATEARSAMVQRDAWVFSSAQGETPIEKAEGCMALRDRQARFDKTPGADPTRYFTAVEWYALGGDIQHPWKPLGIPPGWKPSPPQTTMRAADPNAHYLPANWSPFDDLEVMNGASMFGLAAMAGSSLGGHGPENLPFAAASVGPQDQIIAAAEGMGSSHGAPEPRIEPRELVWDPDRGLDPATMPRQLGPGPQPYGLLSEPVRAPPPPPPPRLIPGVPGIVTGGSSKSLGRAILRTNSTTLRGESFSGWQPHHLIPSEALDAVRSRPVLMKIGMNLDDASNGIMLPEPSTAAKGGTGLLPTHLGYHSVFSEAVIDALAALDITRSVDQLQGDVYRIQQKARAAIEHGEPLYKSKGATPEKWKAVFK